MKLLFYNICILKINWVRNLNRVMVYKDLYSDVDLKSLWVRVLIIAKNNVDGYVPHTTNYSVLYQ